MEIQVLFSKWLTQVAAYLPFGYSFGAGPVELRMISSCRPTTCRSASGAPSSSPFRQSTSGSQLSRSGALVTLSAGKNAEARNCAPLI